MRVAAAAGEAKYGERVDLLAILAAVDGYGRTHTHTHTFSVSPPCCRRELCHRSDSAACRIVRQLTRPQPASRASHTMSKCSEMAQQAVSGPHTACLLAPSASSWATYHTCVGFSTRASAESQNGGSTAVAFFQRPSPTPVRDDDDAPRRRQGGMAASSQVLASFVCGGSLRKRRVDQRQAHAANPGATLAVCHLLTTVADDLPLPNHVYHVDSWAGFSKNRTRVR